MLADFGLTPRTLADDILLTTPIDTPPSQPLLREFATGFDATIAHLHDLGGRVAPSKSKLFALAPKQRLWLNRFVWPSLGTTISVVLQLRDLGSQMNPSNLVHTSLSRQRLGKALTTVHRISKLPHDRHRKALFVQSCGHSQAFYASEAAHVDEVFLEKYVSAVTSCVGTKNQMHSKALTFLLSKHGDMAYSHPLVHLFVRRLTMVRRILAKLPHLQELICSIYDEYRCRQFVGTRKNSISLNSLQPIPPFGETGRQNWKTSGQPFGPIGLLLQSTHNIAATLDLQDGIIRKSGCVELSIL
eukprot:9170356-Karenia_brevis.AAC.1